MSPTTASNSVRSFVLCLVICAVCLSRNSNAEYFSSVDAMETLAVIEGELLETFRQYLLLQKEELDNYRKFIEQVKFQHEVAVEDIDDYLGNPINAFTLIKRMVIDWNQLHDFVKEGEARKALREYLEEFRNETSFPSVEDLNGAVRGLARLQMVYDLNTTDLAMGKIAGSYQSPALTWRECYEIATKLFDEKLYELSFEWFEQILKNFESTEDDPALLKFKLDTYEYMALIKFELNDTSAAIAYIDEILNVVPNHIAKDTKKYMLNNAPSQLHLKNPREYAAKSHPWSTNYTRLCQGIQIPEKVHHRLNCTIETQNKPWFYLAPLKVEQLSIEPEVTLFHGLLTDAQIDQILELAGSNMVRSTVVNASAGTGITSEVRVSQQAWVDYASETMQQVYRLVSEITNLDLGNAEIMQVANYGLGGQYDPHHDFFGPTYKENARWQGDRLATHMFYLSDVELGGFTVFPVANLFLRPVKGAMVKWWNLHKSVSPDIRTLHAGCPVIVGTKRIGNIWVHSGKQELRRPCGLEDDTHISI